MKIKLIEHLCCDIYFTLSLKHVQVFNLFKLIFFLILNGTLNCLIEHNTESVVTSRPQVKNVCIGPGKPLT